MFFDAVAFMDLTDSTHTRTVRMSAAGWARSGRARASRSESRRRRRVVMVVSRCVGVADGGKTGANISPDGAKIQVRTHFSQAKKGETGSIL